MLESKLQQLELVRSTVRAHGLHKQLAIELHMDEATLSKLLDMQLPRVLALFHEIGLEVVPVGHVADLRRILKSVL